MTATAGQATDGVAPSPPTSVERRDWRSLAALLRAQFPDLAVDEVQRRLNAVRNAAHHLGLNVHSDYDVIEVAARAHLAGVARDGY